MHPDLTILQKETQLSMKDVIVLYNKWNGDVVNAILDFRGETELLKKPPEEKLGPVETKIKQLREIVDKKDLIFQQKIDKNK
jgi:hypothetical protein